MVTTPDKHSADTDSQRKTRNAFNLGLLITVASGLVILGTFLMQLFLGGSYYVWITAVGFLGGILGMVAARRGNPFVAAMVLVTALFAIGVLYVLLLDGVATMLIVILILLSLGIVIQTVPNDKLAPSIIIVTIIGVVLIILDQFWPLQRAAPPPHTQLIISLAGVFVIIALTIFVIRQFPKFSLRVKLISATLAVALIAVAAVAIGVNIFTTRAITTQVGSNLNTLAELQSLTIGEFLTAKINTLEALSTNKAIIQTTQGINANYANSHLPPKAQIAEISKNWTPSNLSETSANRDQIIKGILDNEVVAELNRFKTLFPENSQLMVTDKYGALIAATTPPTSYYQGNEEWWQDTYLSGFGSAYIGKPSYNWRINQYSIDVAVPIHGTTESGNGEIVGVLYTSVALKALGDVLQKSQFGESGTIEILLIDNDEYIEDRRLTLDEAGKITFDQEGLAADAKSYAQNPTTPFITTEFNGDSFFLSASPLSTLSNQPALEQLNWIVLAKQQADEILAPVAAQQRVNTILGIIVVISAGVVAAYVGQRIAQPITNLTRVAEEVTAGNLEIQAPIETQDEIGVLAASFNGMTTQLRESIFTLEQRVADRTQALTTSIQVGRQLSTILDEDELVTAVVNQIRDAFDYYQAQIYLLAPDNLTLIMAGGTGEAGQQMLTNHHQLQIGTGLVGRAAELNQIILVTDVTQDKNWLPNPLLPDTQSEAAVPITIGNQIMGVLDIQDNIINGLRPEDSELLQSVANQVAVALRNARLYKEIQQRGQKEAALRSINQKIMNTTDMETAMKVAIRELGQALGTSQTIVRLGHQPPANGNHTPPNNQKENQDPTAEKES